MKNFWKKFKNWVNGYGWNVDDSPSYQREKELSDRISSLASSLPDGGNALGYRSSSGRTPAGTIADRMNGQGGLPDISGMSVRGKDNARGYEFVYNDEYSDVVNEMSSLMQEQGLLGYDIQQSSESSWKTLSAILASLMVGGAAAGGAFGSLGGAAAGSSALSAGATGSGLAGGSSALSAGATGLGLSGSKMPAIAGSLINTAGVAGGSYLNNVLNMKNLRELINEQNEYNTPANQMQRFIDAGLNPNLMAGQVSSGNQPNAGTPHPVDLVGPMLEAVGTMSNVNLQGAQADEIRQRAIAQRNANSLFGLDKSLKELSVNELQSRIDKQIKDLEVMESQRRLNEAQTKSLHELREYDKKLKEAQTFLAEIQADYTPKGAGSNIGKISDDILLLLFGTWNNTFGRLPGLELDVPSIYK